MADDVTIRVQPLGDPWVALGAGEYRGVQPEGVRMTANSHGSDTCSFFLRRDPGAPIPDLKALTPVDVLIDGQLVWSGRIRETPQSDGSDAKISVECQGWQYHLDDDHYERTYVHSRLSDWRDTRTFPAQDLTYWRASANVSSEHGRPIIGFPKGTVTAAADAVGVTLDLGPEPASWARYIYLNITAYAMNAAFNLYVRGHANIGGPHANGAPNTAQDAIVVGNPTTGARAAGFSVGYRYVTIFLYNLNFTGTFGEDHRLRLENIFVYSENSGNFHSSGISTLKASTVVIDALTKATSQISTEQGQISPTSFSIPDFSMTDGPRTPREVIEAVNAFHDYNYSVDVDKRLVFAPKPSVASLEIGNYPGVEFTDASSNSIEDIYNKVTVTGSGPDSGPVRVTRLTTMLTELQANLEVMPGGVNPDLNSNVTGWASSGNVSWVNDLPGHSGPTGATNGYGQSIVGAAGTFWIDYYPAGTFEKNKTYKFTVWALAGSPAETFSVEVGVLGTDSVSVVSPFSTFHHSWKNWTLYWTPKSTTSGNVQLKINWSTTAPNTAYFDEFRQYKSVPSESIFTKMNMTRSKILPVNSPITEAIANQIGDIYLRAHRTTPFKGAFQATGPGVRTVLGGAPVQPYELLRATGKLVRVGHRVDPDTGALGRDGTIASVEYDVDGRQASVQIDNQRKSVEAFLERLAVVTGSALRQ